jgi:NTE family protein
MWLRTSQQLLLGIIFLTLILHLPEGKATEPEKTRPKIGIALSGGGARGMTHVGVLEALEQLRVPIDYIAGTSMGSVVGGLYASGITIDELHHAAVGGIDWQGILSTKEDLESLSYREKQNRRRFLFNLEIGIVKKSITVPSGWIGGHSLFLALKRFTNNILTEDFAKLPIPFKAVATDLKTAEPYLLDHGDLALALRASMAVPFVFAPVEIDGHLLVDGGILENLPVNIVKEMGADIVIAVNVSAPLSNIESGSSFLKVSRQAIDAALIQNTRQALKHADIIITPEIDDYSSTDFSHGEELIRKGREAIENKAILFKNLSITPEEYANYRNQLQARVPPKITQVTPQFVNFNGHSRTSTEILQQTVGNLLQQELSVETIELATKRLMSLNDFEHVTYDIINNKQGQPGVEFNVREKPWGPDYFRFGVNAVTSFDGKADVNLLVRHEKLNINRFGAEWVNEIEFGTGLSILTEFYQPIGYSRRYFLAPYAYFERQFVDVFRDQTAIAEYEVKRLQFGLNIGMNFSNLAVLRLGLRSSSEEAEVRVGEPNLATGNFQENALTFEFGYDDLDDKVFATRGMRLNLVGEIHDKAFKSDSHYQKLEFYTRQHAKISDNITLVSEINLGTFFQSVPPEYESFTVNTIGGLGGLGEFTRGNIGGRQAVSINLGGLFNPIELLRFGKSDMRLLAMLHAGNAWDKYKEIDLGELRFGGLGALVWDSQFGTVLLGMGYTNDGNLRYSLSLGNFF